MDLSPDTLMASFAAGLVGFAVFRYGRKQARPPQVVAGVALMACPYFVTGALPILGASGLIVAGLWVALRSGL